MRLALREAAGIGGEHDRFRRGSRLQSDCKY
jgi:hypothetical protein